MKQLSRESHLRCLIRRNQNFKRLFLNDQDQIKPEAQDFFKWLYQFCYMSRPSYLMNPKTGGIDPLATHVAEGRREVYVTLLELIDADSVKLTRQLTKLQEEPPDDDR